MSKLVRPYCIYTKNKISKIENSLEEIDDKGGETFICKKNHDGWVLTDTFYAFDPNIFPSPFGSQMYQVVNTEKGTQSLIIEYDPYDESPADGKSNTIIQFVSFFKRTPLTVPLYVYQREGGILITYKDLSEPKIGPILYVLPKQPVAFACKNSRCVPVESGTQSIKQCLSSCYNREGIQTFVGETEANRRELEQTVELYRSQQVRILPLVIITLLSLGLSWYVISNLKSK